MTSPIPGRTPCTLVLAFDGTGNDFNDENTNIIRLVSALEKQRTDLQKVYYQPGIGTYVAPTAVWSPTLQKIGKVADQGLAWYLDAHIMGGYKFLMQNYTVGDRICLFGFSRGAYTARCLAGMLHKVGLLPRSNDEQIAFAYERYKDTTDAGKRRAKGFKAAFSTVVSIEFIGVWDTVSSVGVLARHLPFTASNTIVKRFRHALALDEHRAKFKPNPWHRTVTRPEDAKCDPDKGTAVIPPTSDNPLDALENYLRAKLNLRKGSPQRLMSVESAAIDDMDDDDEYNDHVPTDIMEVWFAGCHADVGGGSVENNTTNTLANPSLLWMVNEIIKAETGILFKPTAFEEIEAFETLTVTLKDPVPKHRPAIPSTFLKHAASKHVREKSIESTTAAGSSTAPVTPTTAGRSPSAPPEKTTYGEKLQLVTSPIGDGPDDEPLILAAVVEDDATKDACAPMYDQLAVHKIWWILEYIPVWQYYQDAKGKWHKGFYWNRGRPRDVQDLNPIFHETVRLRMATGYVPKAKLLKGAKVDFVA